MNVAVLGTGAFGLALASIFYENKFKVTMWSPYEDEIKKIKKEHKNKTRLPDYKIPKEFEFTSNLEKAIQNKELIVIATPTGAINNVSLKLKEYIKENQHICIASKGIEQHTCHFPVDVLKKYIKTDNLSVVSGGSFAVDIINKYPIGLSVATKNENSKELLSKAFSNDYIKIRYNTDLLGTEICGAIKNVIAIAAGIIEGLNLPESSKAMFITESINDIKKLIHLLGGNKKTIMSYAGFGDLLLTCTSTKSRNFTFGIMIGKKTNQKKIEEYINTTTIEGLYTLESIYALLKRKDIEMPIITLIYDIIHNEKVPESLIKFLNIKD